MKKDKQKNRKRINPEEFQKDKEGKLKKFYTEIEKKINRGIEEGNGEKDGKILILKYFRFYIVHYMSLLLSIYLITCLTVAVLPVPGTPLVYSVIHQIYSVINQKKLSSIKLTV